MRDCIPSLPMGTDVVRLADYRPADFLAERVEMEFDLDGDATRVRSRISIVRNPSSFDPSASLWLDGRGPVLVSIALNGELLGCERYRVSTRGIEIPDVPDQCVLDIETVVNPRANTSGLGLYLSDRVFCTHCEPEGFQRITYFPDRPDVMARYTVTVIADKASAPVLLSNGNPIAAGEDQRGRHWVTWEDPHPKSSYLFALVAGELACLRDRFTTRSDRAVALCIWVSRAADVDRCRHAMNALKSAMAWDEVQYGFEYDLDVLNVVGVSDLNVGGMENKGLIILQIKNLVADPETATDEDYETIETSIAHEYFHNWTGNRIGCRDWFQLSLKEGLTIFRNQEFIADHGHATVRRIGDVRLLRSSRFGEEASTLKHAVCPQSYGVVGDLFTPTVYFKGAELVRMLHNLLGRAAFREGLAAFATRWDGRAATIEDFLQSMQDASGVCLDSFKRWYNLADTPCLALAGTYDPRAQAYTLRIEQQQVSPPEPPPVPLAIACLAPDGREMPVHLEGGCGAIGGTRVLMLEKRLQKFRFTDVEWRPVLSPLRGFSAPVELTGESFSESCFRFRHDSDAFARWDAGQQAATTLMLDLIRARNTTPSIMPEFATAYIDVFGAARRDPALAVELLSLPSEAVIASKMPVIDVEAVHRARSLLRAELSRRLGDLLIETYHQIESTGPCAGDAQAIGRRALKNYCLDLISAGDAATAQTLAWRQFERRQNMTDVMAALRVLAWTDAPERAAALSMFYERWKCDTALVDKWFAVQAAAPRLGMLEQVDRLWRHSAFDIGRPSRVRALIGTFSLQNPLCFHAADGGGYTYLADRVIDVDRINGEVAARLLEPLAQWPRHDPARRARMRVALERLLAAPDLSRDVVQFAVRSLG